MTALRRRWFAAAALAALLAAGTAAFAQTNAEPQSTPPESPAAEATIHAFGERDKLCAAWTDECRICRRNGAEIACSNISIACQPKDIRCTARTTEKSQ
jgi:hypothetical protein